MSDDRAAQASFLVTSRDRLHVSGEETLALEPMDLEREAISLFEVRALAKLLCAKGLSALAAADSVTARAALAEAESIGTGLGTQPSSELGQLLDALRSSLSGPGRGPVFPSAAGSGTAGGNLVPRAGSEE